MSTGQNIKQIREEKGMTQQQVAELIHMHRSNYSKIESGQREISVEALGKIARYFDDHRPDCELRGGCPRK